MTTIIINAKNRTIELTKTFAKNATKFGSPEYNELKEARIDYPSFKVVTVVKKTARPKFKGLTYEYMEMYITKHDDEEKSIMGEYRVLRAQTKEAEEGLAVSASYNEIKNWFFEKYPDILEKYAYRFKYVLVDEFQDTNSVQYKLVKMLSSIHGNLFVVGDEDQCIYSWRCANFQNIFSIKKDFPDDLSIQLHHLFQDQLLSHSLLSGT